MSAHRSRRKSRRRLWLLLIVGWLAVDLAWVVADHSLLLAGVMWVAGGACGMCAALLPTTDKEG